MSENPFQSPVAAEAAMPIDAADREMVRKVARYQKAVLVCLLASIGINVVMFMVNPESVAVLILFAIALVIMVASFVYVFLLGSTVYNTTIGVVLAILSVIPCISLIVLLVVVGKATKVLQKHGIKVGLLGANLADV